MVKEGMVKILFRGMQSMNPHEGGRVNQNLHLKIILK